MWWVAMAWTQRPRRVFNIDIETCSSGCTGDATTQSKSVAVYLFGIDTYRATHHTVLC